MEKNMQRIKQISLTVISSFSFIVLLNGCMPKNPDGSYNSAYSYDPYNNVENTQYSKYHQYGNYNQRKSNYRNNRYRRENCRDTYERENYYEIYSPHRKTEHQKSRPKDNYNPNNYKSFIDRKSSLTPLGKKIEKIAKSHLGKRYLWGGNGPDRFDCSGLTKSVYKENGITLPRKSYRQARVGKRVSRYRLKKGDLVFFDSPRSRKISHVGIFIGNGDFIHASSSNNGVIISNLNSSYYAKHFRLGRRLTNTNHFVSR
jgi:cell wall-associated NlpC family hydrolase